MKVVLLKDVGGVGKRDTAVEVTDGYALNFLIARGLAVQATPDKLAALKEKQKVVAMTAAAQDAEAAALVKKLNGARVHIRAKANDKRHLYKQLSSDAVAAAIAGELQVSVPASAVHLKAPIKTLGEWDVKISHYGHSAACTIVVEGE